MYRLISFSAIALLAFLATQPAAADDASVCNKADGDDSIAACSRVIARRPRDDGAYSARGLAFERKGDHDHAIADFNAAIAINPRNGNAYTYLGDAYYGRHEYDRAIAAFDQAIAIDPKNALALSDRGAARYDKQDYDGAIADLEQSIRLNSRNAAAYSTRGAAYLAKGDDDLAMADFDRALGLNPNLPIAYSNRGAIHDRRGDYDRAIADFNLAVRIAPKFALAYANRGLVHIHKGEYDAAIADLDTVLGLNPNDAIAYFRRAMAYRGKGDFDHAITDYDQALKIDPSFADARQERERAVAARQTPPKPVALTAPPKPLIQPAPPKPAAQAAPTPEPKPVVQAAPSPKPVVQPAPPREQVTAVVEAQPKPPAFAAGQPARRALVVGIDTYPNLGNAAQLERAVADAEAVGDRLAGLGFAVTRLTEPQDTTIDALLRGFEAFRRSVAPGDMVVLFYAGHGMGLSDGTYLVPSDVREASLEVETTAKRAAINENELTEGLQRARAGIVVAVIDACRNDLFSRAARRAMGNERGLRPVETEGIFKLYSASEGQTALDRLPGSDGSKNSVFTRVFLRALGTPGLNLSALGTTVRDEVYRIAKSADHAQIPAVYDKLIGSTQVYVAGEGR